MSRKRKFVENQLKGFEKATKDAMKTKVPQNKGTKKRKWMSDEISRLMEKQFYIRKSKRQQEYRERKKLKI